ncbi:hypothetical protein DEIPH_ctg060orf0034 [Deinococcus phoenicis]|uniref:Uncharacterized protein n=1 Tax=Deinococcus phoenicis TaxID=1476583 RepID=A0A016QMF1_9DEIO|nr:hypothetical protein [Deinococcus phoenicis]EYB66954.1 hypothetical protein DEIPH_ctg060orf0034 [Deinococcus phoenicis]
MAYKKLSEQLQELGNPQRSDAFVRQFREAVREGKIDATYLPERFTLPKEFKRRGAEGSYQRDSREMLFEVTPDFEQWFEQTNNDLAATPTRRSGTPKPTAENIEAGVVDFKALAEETRRKMQASYEKGQALGRSRSQGRAKKGTGTRKTARRK